MNAKKCDRCGAYYDENKMYKETNLIPGSVLIGMSLLCRDSRYGNEYDLCDSCLTDLKEFLKNE